MVDERFDEEVRYVVAQESIVNRFFISGKASIGEDRIEAEVVCDLPTRDGRLLPLWKTTKIFADVVKSKIDFVNHHRCNQTPIEMEVLADPGDGRLVAEKDLDLYRIQPQALKERGDDVWIPDVPFSGDMVA